MGDVGIEIHIENARFTKFLIPFYFSFHVSNSLRISVAKNIDVIKYICVYIYIYIFSLIIILLLLSRLISVRMKCIKCFSRRRLSILICLQAMQQIALFSHMSIYQRALRTALTTIVTYIRHIHPNLIRTVEHGYINIYNICITKRLAEQDRGYVENQRLILIKSLLI